MIALFSNDIRMLGQENPRIDCTINLLNFVILCRKDWPDFMKESMFGENNNFKFENYKENGEIN